MKNAEIALILPGLLNPRDWPEKMVDIKNGLALRAYVCQECKYVELYYSDR